MIKRLIYVIIALIFVQETLLSQTDKQTTDTIYILGFSTYLSQMDRYFSGFGVCCDDEGFIYISGNTRDKNFPVSENAYQKELKGDADAFVAKFSKDGDLIFATLIGGSKREHHTGLTVDEEGCIYLVGGTHSDDFPVTPEAYDTTFNGEQGWGGDVFIVKFNPAGSKMIFSTFIGGSAQETAHKILLDTTKNIIIGGTTLSKNFPTTENAFDKVCGGTEGFVAKFNPECNRLIYSTLIGGEKVDSPSGLAIDEKGNIFLAGTTTSEDFQVTDDAIRKNLEIDEEGNFRNGDDLFLAKINKKGELEYSTYYAGRSRVACNLVWRSPNKLMFCGSVDSKNFPITENAICKEFKGDRDAFISIFDSDKMSLEYSTIFGGSQLESIRNAYFLNDEMVVVSGATNSADFPLTGGAIRTDYPKCDSLFSSSFFGRRMAFVSLLNIKERKLVYSTFIGACLRFKTFPDDEGNLGYMAETGTHVFPETTDFPVTDNARELPWPAIMVGRLEISEKVH